MGVSMNSHGHSNKGKQQQSNNQCIATLVCMLSCDDGYKLGPKGQDGCQTCECTKHKNKDETCIIFNLNIDLRQIWIILKSIITKKMFPESC
jgi:hypothetical protein